MELDLGSRVASLLELGLTVLARRLRRDLASQFALVGVDAELLPPLINAFALKLSSLNC